MKTIVTALSMFVALNAEAQDHRITIDLGSVTIKLMSTSDQDRVTYVLPDDCKGTTVNVKTEAEGLRITHAGTHCPSGARIMVPVNVDGPVTVDLKSGTVNLVDPSNLASAFSGIDLKVDAGLINSERIRHHRINHFAGEQGELKGPFTSHRRLTVHVASGVIVF